MVGCFIGPADSRVCSAFLCLLLKLGHLGVPLVPPSLLKLAGGENLVEFPVELSSLVFCAGGLFVFRLCDTGFEAVDFPEQQIAHSAVCSALHVLKLRDEVMLRFSFFEVFLKFFEASLNFAL